MMWNGLREREVLRVMEAVRAELVGGRLRPGSEVVLAELSEQLDVTMSAVQEALTRLVGQRLVTSGSDGSFHVTAASRHDLHELTALRQLLEGDAVRASVQRGDEDWASHVQSAYEDLVAAETGSVASDPSSSERWRAAHTAFHEALCAAAGSDRLLGLVSELRDEAEIYRELSASVGTPERWAVVTHEHLTLRDLALEGRADEAAAALRAHLGGTMRSIADALLKD